jgi:prophage regulatory protein
VNTTEHRRRLVRRPEVESKTGLSTAEIYRRMAADPPTFPRSVATGPNTRAWVEDEIDDWIDERIDARDQGADADLRVVNPHIGKGRPRRDDATRPAVAGHLAFMVATAYDNVTDFVLADAADAMARLETSIPAASPAVTEGLRARAAHREATELQVTLSKSGPPGAVDNGRSE